MKIGRKLQRFTAKKEQVERRVFAKRRHHPQKGFTTALGSKRPRRVTVCERLKNRTRKRRPNQPKAGWQSVSMPTNTAAMLTLLARQVQPINGY
jgi:hypothetical protein